jgi:hypothetical protein
MLITIHMVKLFEWNFWEHFKVLSPCSSTQFVKSESSVAFSRCAVRPTPDNSYYY